MPVFHRPLPENLHVLRELALDLHWSWNHTGDLLWKTINCDVWEQTQNPICVLQLTSDQVFQQLSQDSQFLHELHRMVVAQQEYLEPSGWFTKNYRTGKSFNNSLRTIAYFSMEFGLCEALPLYAGGLGMLAGDFLKTASDLGVPLIGIGLLYQQGYFRQNFNANGWQQETYLFNDPGTLPVQPLRASDGSWLHIDTQFLCRHVRFRVWHAQVGKVSLYLLDSNDPCNQIVDRDITSTLYGGNLELRLMQELALGICGWRLIEALNLDVDICHLNEGHAAFATLERINSHRKKHRSTFETALWATRSGNIFTTHTAVAAGFDIYSDDLLRPYIFEIAQELNVDVELILKLGKADGSEVNNFNMAYLAMNTCAYTNAVSELHEKVSQQIFQPLFPRWPTREIPIGHVTNGIHIPSWDSSSADELWEIQCGKDRWREFTESLSVDSPQHISDTQLWQMATRERDHLVQYVRERLTHQVQNRASAPNCVTNIAMPLDPNILTLGFARRFAEYKRPNLLLHDPARLAALLTNDARPVQLLVAGKAHPADEPGKLALQAWHQFIRLYDVGRHVVFIEDYDITLAQELVRGVDVWINTPRRPWEACGTSGMKVLVNGGLNISTLDGWWAEAYEQDVGWAIGRNENVSGEENNIASMTDDALDAEQLYCLLESQVIPLFYYRDNQGLPLEWLKYMRASMLKLTTRFGSVRMLKEYLDKFYIPAANNLNVRQANELREAKKLEEWSRELHKHWHEIHISDLQKTSAASISNIAVSIYLGGIKPEAVKVQLIADSTANDPAVLIEFALMHQIEGAINAYRYTASLFNNRPLEHFTARVIPSHSLASIPAENRLIFWQTRLA